jgi:hypothetical protein
VSSVVSMKNSLDILGIPGAPYAQPF